MSIDNHTASLLELITSFTTDISVFEPTEFTIGNDDRVLSDITTLHPLNITHIKKAATAAQYLYKVMVPLIGTFIIFLNGLIVVSSGLILQRNIHPKTTYFCLGNVALCDLITGIAVIFGSVYPMAWRSHMVCCIQMGKNICKHFCNDTSIYIVFFYYLFIIKNKHYIKFKNNCINIIYIF